MFIVHCQKKKDIIMINSVRFKSASIISMAFLLTFVPIYSAAMDQKTPLTKQGTKINKQDKVLNAFEQIHARIIEHVKQNVLPIEAGVKADELQISLKKYLIQSEARLQILKLDVLHEKGDKQKKALDEMMNLSAEREQTKMNYLERLKVLIEGIDIVDTPAPPGGMVHKKETRTEKTFKNKKDLKWKEKILDVEIEITPEDISHGGSE